MGFVSISVRKHGTPGHSAVMMSRNISEVYCSLS